MIMKCRWPMLVNCKGHDIYVPCGKCAWCISRERDMWVFRMKQESKKHLYNFFLTFTYRDADLPMIINEDTGEMVNSVNKLHIREFHRKLWKKGLKFRYLLASEYGSKTLRPHYHAIYWCDTPIDFEKEWPYGDNNVQLPADEGSYKYVLKYMLKGSKVPPGAEKNFRLMSRKPGIGSEFDYKGDRYLLTANGVKMAVPRYYRKNYSKVLDERLKNELTEIKLEEMENVIPWRELEKRYEASSFDGSFDDWLYYIYGRDLKKQHLINNKNE